MTIEQRAATASRAANAGAVVYGVGLNYAAQVAQEGQLFEGFPPVFIKHPRSVVRAGNIELPADATDRRYDIEVELAVIIGRRLWRPTLAQARAAITGVAIGVDVTDRHLMDQGQVTLAKGQPTFCFLGPTTALADGDSALRPRRIRTWIDDRLVQDGTTADMNHQVDIIVDFLATYTPLEPGDVILTGSPGAVSGERQHLVIGPGSRVNCEIEGIGGVVTHAISTG